MNRKLCSGTFSGVMILVVTSLVLLLQCWKATKLEAVVVATTTGNTSAPEDDPGWANVGVRGGASAVYLGNGWVITAAHVGVGSVEFPELSETFASDSATASIPIRNPGGLGLSETTDLMLFKLDGLPALPSLSIAAQRADVDTEVVMIGHGLDRDEEMREWSVNSTTGTAPVIWTEVADGAGQFQGFQVVAESRMRWGLNSIDFFVEPNSSTPMGSNGHVFSFATDFDFARNQAQAAKNDSGGGVFVKQDDAWQLAGIMVAVNGFRGQQLDEQVLFGNQTLSADLTIYRAQIVAAIPEPQHLVWWLFASMAVLFQLRRRR